MRFLLLIIFFICIPLTQTQECINMPLNSIISTYSIGDTISIDDQLRPYNVCYSSENNSNNTFRLADFNGNLNGGHYRVTLISMNASW